MTGLGHISRPREINYLNATEVPMLINSLTLEQYHDICFWKLSRTQTITVPADATLNLGTVFVCSSGDQLQDWVGIVSWTDVEVGHTGWHGAKGEVMSNGWTRYVFYLKCDLS
jgi:hypothetical protein